MKRVFAFAVLVIACLVGQPAADARSPMPVPRVGGLRFVGGREWLEQMLPGFSRTACLASTRDPAARLFVEETQRAEERLGLRAQVVTMGGAEDFEGAFGTMRREQAGALIIQPIFVDQTQRVAELAVRNRLPTASYQ